MASWNPAQYGTFLEWRTRPSRDLAQRIDLQSAPRRIIDLGCGPGNSTAVCADRWPSASILGIDNSPEMIAAAQTAHQASQFEVGDIAKWILEAADAAAPIDLIFSCAALQWIDDHSAVFPRLLRKLAPGGVLAVHMPAYDAVPNRLMREIAASERWRKWFPTGRAGEWRSHPLEFYYGVLAREAKWLDLWQTDYLQSMPSTHAIVDWYASTGLRPYLDQIRDDQDQRTFLDQYQARLEPFFPASESGGVPFLFRRIFIIAGV
ncbi:MAG TPA: methyltransferase domain-containing protein [Bryobacteraceae bacterium]|jgi:trans-aconitate 2-methyltransferase